jgi:hypothetical protein
MVTLTKDLPATYTKSGLEELLRKVAVFVPHPDSWERSPAEYAVIDAYWEWVRNEDMKERQFGETADISGPKEP